jgi:hypothetical protein
MYIHLTMNLGITVNIKYKLGRIMATACARHILVKQKKALELKDKIESGSDFVLSLRKIRRARQLKKAEI